METSDLVVRRSFAYTDAAYLSSSFDFMLQVKETLRAEVEKLLPPGYGQEYGDFARYVSSYDPKTRMNTITYEVHL